MISLVFPGGNFEALTMIAVILWLGKMLILVMVGSLIIVGVIEVLKRILSSVVIVELKDPVSVIHWKGKPIITVDVGVMVMWAINIVISYVESFKVCKVEFWYFNIGLMILILFTIQGSYLAIKNGWKALIERKTKDLENGVPLNNPMVNSTIMGSITGTNPNMIGGGNTLIQGGVINVQPPPPPNQPQNPQPIITPTKPYDPNNN